MARCAPLRRTAAGLLDFLEFDFGLQRPALAITAM
jgi:hypothetical protein